MLDALDRGFASVEADVFWVGEALLVAHDPWQVRPERTLQRLYLEPLAQRVRARGSVFGDGAPFWLLVDQKSEAAPTYRALCAALTAHADVFGPDRPVRVVVSGDRPPVAAVDPIAPLDGRIHDLDEPALPAAAMPWISDRWSRHFDWSGVGRMPDAERARLAEIVARTHARGQQLRFWATPEAPAVWRELVDAGVDRIGTDNLDGLRVFLQAQPPRGANR